MNTVTLLEIPLSFFFYILFFIFFYVLVSVVHHVWYIWPLSYIYKIKNMFVHMKPKDTTISSSFNSLSKASCASVSWQGRRQKCCLALSK